MYKCIICGREFAERVYMNPYEKVCSSECFSIEFWNEKVGNPAYTIIDGRCYQIAPENDYGWFRGCSGREFFIQMDGGEVIRTTNLWVQGDIPDTHIHLLPNNARFISEEEYEKQRLQVRLVTDVIS